MSDDTKVHATWGEPEDRILRARQLATRKLATEDKKAAELLIGTGAARIGVNEDVRMFLIHVCPDRQSDETYFDVPLDQLAAESEAELATRIALWATSLVQSGHSAGEDAKWRSSTNHAA